MNLRFLLKIQNSYKKFLVSFIEKTDFELVFSLPKIDASNNKELENYFHFYKDLAKKCKIRYEYKNTRNGEVPVKLVFEDEKSYLTYIEKLEDFKRFKENYEFLKKINLSTEGFSPLNDGKSENSLLNNWVLKNISEISKYDLNFWKKIILVVKYFLKNKKSNKYLRELDIKIDTKFIEINKRLIKSILYFLLELDEKTDFEQHFGIKQKPQFIRFRFLDDNLKQEYFGKKIDDILVRVEDFFSKNNCKDVALLHLYSVIKNIFITENEINYLTFPKNKNSIIIWGAGFKVNILKNVEFLKNKNIFYWGDIDSHGFKILANLRKYFPKTKSIFMDKKVFEKFEEYIVKGQKLSESEIENLQENLTKEEFELLKYVNENNLRLEQESINQNYILENL